MTRGQLEVIPNLVEEECEKTPNLIGFPAEAEKFPEPTIPKPTDLPKESGLARALRISIAIPLLALSCVALAPFSIMPISSQAVVNARLSTVEAPVSGRVGDVKFETGDRIDNKQVLAIMGPSPLKRMSGDSDDSLSAESSRVGAALAADEAEKARYDVAYEAYVRRSINDLNGKIGEATRNAQREQRRLDAANEDLARDRQALRDHLVSRTVVDHDSEIVEQAQQTADAAASDLDHLKKQLSGFRSGYTPASGSDAPAFLAQRDQTLNEIDQLREQKTAVDQRLSQASEDREKKDTFAHGSQPIQSPVSGIIWARSVAGGQIVQAGDDLFHIADEGSIHVEVWLDRRYGPQLSIGDPALVYMSGLGQELKGRISSFEGTSHRRLDEKINAIDLQAVHPDQYHVTIELDPADRKVAYIGQAAKVLFPGTNHTLRARIYFWLTRI
jgi:multidrug resistance efflux pump